MCLVRVYTRWEFNILKEYYMRPITNIGFILLAIYLILLGIMAIVPAIPIPSIAMGILALIAGIFILLGK